MCSPADPGAGGAVLARDPDAGREADDYGPGAGGKKRKVPAYPQVGGKNEDQEVPFDVDPSLQPVTKSTAFTPNFRLARSISAKACSFRKALYLRRKAALITLYLDAQSATIGGSARSGPHKSSLLEVSVFEKLIPSLEDLGIYDWAPDKPGWRNKWDDEKGTGRVKTLEQWRTAFMERQKVKTSRKPVVRGGWAPEGSFEFEMDSKASAATRSRAKNQAMLQKLAIELRAAVLSSYKQPPPVLSPASDEKPPSKTKRQIDLESQAAQVSAAVESEPLEGTLSKDGSETAGGKKKPKKKKRSVLANQSNPHHVNNYRPSRTVSPYGDPYEPYPHHSSLLFPPPMRLLSASPGRIGRGYRESEPARPSEDEFICSFCEIELFFSTETARKRAIRRLKAERKRKETIKVKAKNVAEGKGKLKEEEEDYDDDDEELCEDDEYGHCTCGRALAAPHRSTKSRLKPPETDPPWSEDD